MAAWNPSATRAASCLCGQVAERGCVHHGRGLTTSTRSKRKGLRANLKGLVFNDYDFGGFLIHAGIPAFIDGRAELFGGDFIKRYTEAVSLRGEEPLGHFLDRHGIEWTLLRKVQPANKLLGSLPGWRPAFSDDVATVFARRH